MSPPTQREQRCTASHPRRLGSSPFARRYLGNLGLISLPPGTEMVQFPGSRLHTLCVQACTTGLQPARLPHSGTQGSLDVCSSPWLFAAYHALLRPVAPRHPPWTLIRLTIFLSYSLAPAPARRPRITLSARGHIAPYGSHGHQCSTQPPSRASLRSRSPSLVLSKTCAHHPNTSPWRWSHKTLRCLQHSVL